MRCYEFFNLYNFCIRCFVLIIEMRIQVLGVWMQIVKILCLDYVIEI